MTDNNIKEFTGYLKYEKRYSQHTIKAYEKDLNEYAGFIQKTYGPLPLHEHTHTFIRTWLSNLLSEGLSSRSVSRKMTSLKSFFKYCLQNEYVEANPTTKLQPIRTKQRLPVFVHETDMSHLLENIKFEDSYGGTRDFTILKLLYGTGMRVSELINLQVQDINASTRSLKVLGKRNKERIIPLSDELFQTLDFYLKQRENFVDDLEHYTEKDCLFLSGKGNKTYPKLIYTIVKKYLEQVSTIDKKSPHVLRHTFATHLLSHGADLNAIKELLGHANLAATQVYTHNTIDQLKSVYKQAHPKGK